MGGDGEGEGQTLDGEAVLDVPAAAGEEAKLRPDQAESRFVAVLPGASAEPFARPAGWPGNRWDLLDDTLSLLAEPLPNAPSADILDPIDALFARIGE